MDLNRGGCVGGKNVLPYYRGGRSQQEEIGADRWTGRCQGPHGGHDPAAHSNRLTNTSPLAIAASQNSTNLLQLLLNPQAIANTIMSIIHRRYSASEVGTTWARRPIASY